MKRTRHLIAVALVATALCADRAVASAPQVRSEGSVASRIVSRLTSGLRRAVSSNVRIYQTRAEAVNVPALAISRIEDRALIHPHPTFSESEFRLPPPVL